MDFKYYLLQLARELDNAERDGYHSGVEGTSYIKISDTLAKEISNNLRQIVAEM